MSRLPLTRKVEKAFAADYLPKHLVIAGLKIYEGHERADEMEFPALVVYGENSQPHPEMPTSTGVRIVRIRMQFVVDSESNDRGALDEWKRQLEDAMMCRPKMQAALNAPESGIDRRKVTGIHFHDAMIGEDPSDRNNTDWVEDCNFEVVCEWLT